MWHSVIDAHFGGFSRFESETGLEGEGTEVDSVAEAAALPEAWEEDSPGSGKTMLEAKKATVKQIAQLSKTIKAFVGLASNPKLLSNLSAPTA